MKKFLSILLSVTVLFTFVFFAVASGRNTDDIVNTAESSTTVKTESSNLIYNGNIVNVELVEFSNSVVENMFDLYIRAENKLDKSVTVMLKDVCINGSMVEVGSGVPCDILARANRTHCFFGRLDLAGVTSVEDVNKLSFKVWVVDENLDTIFITNDLNIVI